MNNSVIISGGSRHHVTSVFNHEQSTQVKGSHGGGGGKGATKNTFNLRQDDPIINTARTTFPEDADSTHHIRATSA